MTIARAVRRLLLPPLLAVGLAAAACGAQDPVVSADGATTTTSAPSSTTTTAPPPTTTAPAQPVAIAANRPIAPPRNPRQAEPYVVVGTIEIPKIGLRAPIGEGISLTIIDRGPAHWPGTAMPGQPGNVVIAGHRVTHTRPFRNIDRLVPGDEVIFEVGGARHVYRMTRHEIVTPQGMHIVEQTAEPTATLFACHPPGSARYRYVVHLALAQ